VRRLIFDPVVQDNCAINCVESCELCIYNKLWVKVIGIGKHVFISTGAQTEQSVESLFTNDSSDFAVAEMDLLDTIADLTVSDVSVFGLFSIGVLLMIVELGTVEASTGLVSIGVKTASIGLASTGLASIGLASTGLTRFFANTNIPRSTFFSVSLISLTDANISVLELITEVSTSGRLPFEDDNRSLKDLKTAFVSPFNISNKLLDSEPESPTVC
jgi:hypothetical protein